MGISCHGINGQISSFEVLFKRDIRACFKGKAPVARRNLAFAPGERILFGRFGVQKDRKILAHAAVPLRQERFSITANDDPVTLFGFKPKECIPDKPSDQIDPHFTAPPPQTEFCLQAVYPKLAKNEMSEGMGRREGAPLGGAID